MNFYKLVPCNYIVAFSFEKKMIKNAMIWFKRKFEGILNG